MLRVTQQRHISKVVKPDMVRALGINLMKHMKERFPFAMISLSVHQMCAHSWELFEMTNGRPIAIYSEQCGESWNKHILSYKFGVACRARQTSVCKNTQDVFTRMMVKSHPCILSKKRKVTCSRCFRSGHTSRSCSLNYSVVCSEEQAFINSCFF